MTMRCEDISLFNREKLKLDVQEAIAESMQRTGMKRSEIATAIGRSKPFVTQCLRDGHNLTLETIADILTAMNSRLVVVPALDDSCGWKKK